MELLHAGLDLERAPGALARREAVLRLESLEGRFFARQEVRDRELPGVGVDGPLAEPARDDARDILRDFGVFTEDAEATDVIVGLRREADALAREAAGVSDDDLSRRLLDELDVRRVMQDYARLVDDDDWPGVRKAGRSGCNAVPTWSV